MDILKSIEWNFTEAKASPFSSIHPYPAKFINEIPATLIKNLWHGQGDFVLDPFCGSGVTLEEAQRRGISSVGIDLNPIACLISRVRTNQLPEAFLNICEAIVKDCQTLDTIIEVPALPNIDHWFKADIQEALAKLKHSIDNYKGTEVYDALLYCFSSIIVKVSNQDSDTRYAFRDKGKTASDVYSYFLLSARKLTKAMMGNPHAEARVLNKNSLKLTSEDLPGKIGLVVTSPPYPNAYEYWLYHKYRMYWLGFNPIQVKNEEIGARAQYFKKSKYEGYDFAIQMSELLSMLYPYCSDDAYLCFVIGRSKIHGEIYCNDKIIAEIGMNAGFRHITTLQREINCKRKSFNLSHARIKDEYIVILQK
ncbi:MAG: hypothetical protein IJ064_03385 [Bacteroidaceae bacterium]|nr:hypothetical protein [Bacteroidaceae bacterium]